MTGRVTTCATRRYCRRMNVEDVANSDSCDSSGTASNLGENKVRCNFGDEKSLAGLRPAQ